jgi:FixJ family two-component response regulator
MAPATDCATLERGPFAFEPLLLTDIIMPSIGGCELAERLGPSHPEMKLLFMSGYSDSALLRDAPIAEEAVLQKPFLPRARAGKVRETPDRVREG